MLLDHFWERERIVGFRAPSLLGYGAIIIMFGTFGLWSLTAPISGAAVAPGTIAAAGRNIQIQHLEGGIVRSIDVREGDVVNQGDTLMKLDDTAARTQLNRLIKQWVALTTQSQRLAAERDLLDVFTPQISLPFVTHITFEDVLEAENKEFEARKARFRSEQSILNERLFQLEDTRRGVDLQKAAIDKQAEVIKEELTRKQALLDKGLINRTDYTELLRIDADLLGQAAVITSQQASISSQLSEAREQIQRQATQRVEEAVTKLTEVRNSLRDVEEQIASASAVLDRTIVRAPADGIIVNSVYNVVGNVFSPGEKVMEIVPTRDDPIIEARLKPTDIDVVKTGQRARVRLTALNARLTPEIDAIVENLSADRLVDPVNKEPYYRALIKISGSLPGNLTRDDLRPGMPVESFITTGDRTFASYLVKPLLDSARHAFVED